MPTRTASQRRAAAKQEFDAYLDRCPSRQVFDMIGNKWTGLVVTALHDGPARHSELRRRIAGVSQKMLTQSLRDLERDGLVTRTVTASVPVRVDYELTGLGQSLWQVVEPLKAWSEEHMSRILEHRGQSNRSRH